MRKHLLSDVHAPSKWRVLGLMANSPEFYEAFGVKPGQPMHRVESELVLLLIRRSLVRVQVGEPEYMRAALKDEALFVLSAVSNKSTMKFAE